MSYDLADIIDDYHEKCATLLQDAAAGSAEQSAYSHILQAIDRDKDRPANERVGGIAATLMALYRASSHPEVRVIIQKWAKDFIRDTGIGDPRVHF